MVTRLAELVRKALQLTPEEKIDLIGVIWDSLDDREMPEPTQAQKDELDRRRALNQRDPSRAIPFEESMRRVRDAVERGRAKHERRE